MKPQAWDAGRLGSSPPQRWTDPAQNPSVSESLGAKVAVGQVDLVYTPKFRGHGQPTAPSAIEIGLFPRGVQPKVTVTLPFFLDGRRTSVFGYQPSKAPQMTYSSQRGWCWALRRFSIDLDSYSRTSTGKPLKTVFSFLPSC